MDDAPRFAPDALRTAVDWAITSRRSVRAFLPTAVPRATIEEILAVARRAPSGTNMQPWKVHVLTGPALAGLVSELLEAAEDPDAASAYTDEYDDHARGSVSPYLERRRKVGRDLYALLGIDKRDTERVRAHHARNLRFFDAPVGLMFTVDRIMGRSRLLDCGMFLQNVMVAARARGLDTCPQAAFTRFHRVIEARLGIPSTELLLSGMALGHADETKPENRLRTEREPVAAFTTFHDGSGPSPSPGP